MLKNVYFDLMLSSLVALLAPISSLICLVLFLVFVDLITAIWSGVKKNNVTGFVKIFKFIQSSKLRLTFIKLFLYELSIIITFLVPYVIFGKTFYIVELFTSYISLIEIKSIAENMDIIEGSGNNKFAILFKKFEKILNKKINDTVK